MNTNTKLRLSIVASLAITVLNAESAIPPRIEWQQSYGGNSTDSLMSIQQTSDGGSILCGWSGSGPSGNKTSPYFGISDLWVVRLDASGHMLWDKAFGGVSQEGVQCGIRQTRDGGFILAGQSNSGSSGNKTTPEIYNPGFFAGYYDLWVLRLDASGNKLWESSFGGFQNEFFAAIEETSDGGFILGGSSDSGVTGNKISPNRSNPNPSGSNQGLLDYWLVRLDANGVKMWDRSFGGVSDDTLYAVQQTLDGGFILGGESGSPASGNKTSPGFPAPFQHPIDFWVVRVDPAGNKLWEESYGGTGWDRLYALLVTTDGGFLFGGYSYSDTDGNKSSARLGIVDYWVVRADAAGEKIWDKTYGSGGVDILRAAQATGDGGFVLSGYSDATHAGGRVGNKTSPSHGQADFWTVRIDGLGNALWDTSLGGSATDVAFDLKPTDDGGFLIGGESLSSANGNKTSPSFGSGDFWVVKLAPEDSDADGIPDLHDACADTPIGSVVDNSGCSLGQHCPCDGPWRSHGHYVFCVLKTSSKFLKAGLISHAERRRILKQAIRSDCGKRHPSKYLRQVSKNDLRLDAVRKSE